MDLFFSLPNPCTCLLTLLLLLQLLSPTAVAHDTAYPIKVTDSDCDCFQTLGEEDNYFQYHKFWDFRSLRNYYQGIPKVKETLEGARDASETSSYFNTNTWTSSWVIQNWNNGGENHLGGGNYPMMNSFSNVYIDLNGDSEGDDVTDTYLVLRTAKLEDFQSAAEFQSQGETYHYLSMRAYARTVGDPGACTAIFTYRETDDVDQVQEADMEILTSGPDNKVQFTNQPSYTPEGDTIDNTTKNATMPPTMKWTEWTRYRLDWSPGVTSWYVNSDLLSSIKFQAPRDPASLILNAWSDGGAWTGRMEEGNRAYMQLQWLEMVYNTTAAGGSDGERRRNRRALVDRSESFIGWLIRREEEKKDGCAKVCSVDTTNVTGTPFLLYDNGIAPAQRTGCFGWALSVAVLGLALLLYT